MVPLSTQTKTHVAALFSPDDVVVAEEVLVNQWGDNLPLVNSPSPASLERIRFAVLRLSRGNLRELKLACDAAGRDWRDVLVAADFANDANAHLRWKPSRGQ